MNNLIDRICGTTDPRRIFAGMSEDEIVMAITLYNNDFMRDNPNEAGLTDSEISEAASEIFNLLSEK